MRVCNQDDNPSNVVFAYVYWGPWDGESSIGRGLGMGRDWDRRSTYLRSVANRGPAGKSLFDASCSAHFPTDAQESPRSSPSPSLQGIEGDRKVQGPLRPASDWPRLVWLKRETRGTCRPAALAQPNKLDPHSRRPENPHDEAIQGHRQQLLVMISSIDLFFSPVSAEKPPSLGRRCRRRGERSPGVLC